MIMVRAAALDPMDLLIASGYGAFIRKFIIKHSLKVSEYFQFTIIILLLSIEI